MAASGMTIPPFVAMDESWKFDYLFLSFLFFFFPFKMFTQFCDSLDQVILLFK